MERFASVAGLVLLTGLAWLFSNRRRLVRARVVLWGVALQFLFAVIILSRGGRSFLGMFAFAFLIVLYLLEEETRHRFGRPWVVGGAALAAAGVAVAVVHRLAPYRVTTALLAVALVTLAVAGARRRPHLLRWSGAAAVLLGFCELWARQLDGQAVFAWLSEKVTAFLGLANLGAAFLFGNLADRRYFFPPAESGWPGFGFQFAFSVLPTIIFFSAFMSILYHLGVVQVVIAAMARFMRWSMGTSGPETVSCTANIFVGQTEAPFLVKPFLRDMTVSELHAVMVGGFATIAGGVLAGYVQMGINPGHLIAASVMSAPAALVMAKLLFPETEASALGGRVEIPRARSAENLVGAAADGVTDGLKLALNVAAMLLAFIALIALVDRIFGLFDRWIDGRLLGGALVEATGEYAGVVPGSLRTLFGTVLRPLAFAMGVPWKDAAGVGNLLGVKLSVNEFVAYTQLAGHVSAGDLSERAVTIATYALCGFANFSSVGIQIGGIGALAPERRSDLARIGLRAMFGGALASWMTATIAGILL